MTSFFKTFIPCHSDLCAPLLKLIRKNEKFIWTNECQESFETLNKSTRRAASASEYAIAVQAKCSCFTFYRRVKSSDCRLLSSAKIGIIRPIAYSSVFKQIRKKLLSIQSRVFSFSRKCNKNLLICTSGNLFHNPFGSSPITFDNKHSN